MRPDPEALRVSDAEPSRLPAGLRSHQSQGGELDYFAYVPESASPVSRVLVSVHGIERKALQHAVRFAPYAQSHGFIVLAPVFSKQRMPRYQRAQAGPSGECPLDAFELTVDHFMRSAGLARSGIDLFGYSGGAQFAMRYALMGALRVRRLALAAPGWFTMPDYRMPYPYGLGPGQPPAPRDVDLDRLVSTPTLLLVGDQDNRRDASLNREPLLDEAQGKNRLERAVRWHDAMTRVASLAGAERAVELMLLPGAGHDFNDNVRTHDLGRHVFAWLDQ